MENHRWHVRVNSTLTGRASVYVRRHRFEIGAPIHFDQEYDAITALEYFLGAMGADVVNGLQAVARRRRVPIDEIEATVSGELNNPLVPLGVIGEQGHAGVEKITMRVYINSLASPEDVQRLWEEMLDKSPLVSTFSGALKMELSFRLEQ